MKKNNIYNHYIYIFYFVCIWTRWWKKVVTVTEHTTQEKQKSTSCVPKNAFGLDLGVVAMSNLVTHLLPGNVPTYAFGMRYVHHFLPYFGVDFFKLNCNFGFKRTYSYAYFNPQLMMGVRGNTPAFFKCMSGYAAFRAGYGLVGEAVSIYDNYGDMAIISGGSRGACFELEVGINLFRNMFIAYSYNWQR